MVPLRTLVKNMEMLEKSEIRKYIKEKRKQLDSALKEQWDESICRKVLSMYEIRHSFCVYCYVSFDQEAGTHKLIEYLIDMGKYVAVPRVEGDRMYFYAIQSLQDLEPGVMGIMEPKKTCLKVRDAQAPVIVPGVAFDRDGHRIGYGGGYYDRFFEEEPLHPRFAVAYEFQVMDRFPVEEHDKGMDRIILP